MRDWSCPRTCHRGRPAANILTARKRGAKRRGGGKVARVIVSGYYGFGNIGDEAVLAGIVRSFAQRCPRAELVALSSDPAGTAAAHGIGAVSRMSAGELFAALRGADLLLSGGGSLLQDVTSSRSLMYYLGVIWLAKRMRKKVMVYAQGVGPISGRHSRRAVRSVLNRVDLITVRDEPSKSFLAELGVSRPEVRVTADPSFAMQPAADEEVTEILRAAGVPEESPLIGVSLRPWKSQPHWLPSLAQGLESAAAKIGGSLVFLPMQKDQDLGISVQVASGMAVPAYVVPAQLTPGQMLGVVGRMSLIVGMRLHALIFSAHRGVPFIGVSYDPKVDAFVRTASQESPIGLDGLSSSDVAARVSDAWERREELAAGLSRNTEELLGAALVNADLACDLVGL